MRNLDSILKNFNKTNEKLTAYIEERSQQMIRNKETIKRLSEDNEKFTLENTMASTIRTNIQSILGE